MHTPVCRPTCWKSGHLQRNQPEHVPPQLVFPSPSLFLQPASKRKMTAPRGFQRTAISAASCPRLTRRHLRTMAMWSVSTHLAARVAGWRPSPSPCPRVPSQDPAIPACLFLASPDPGTTLPGELTAARQEICLLGNAYQ